MQFILEHQAQFTADIQQLQSVAANLYTLHEELARKLTAVTDVVHEVAQIQKQAEEEKLLAEQQRQSAEEENRKAHQRYEEAHRRYEEAHRATEERLNILIQHFDEWRKPPQ